jgi:hypothetical protein
MKNMVNKAFALTSWKVGKKFRQNTFCRAERPVLAE